MSRNMLIIVLGLPGSGKSYFASRLSREWEAEYVNSDQIRKAMSDIGRYAFEDELNVYEEMANIAGKNLRLEKTIVVDATFYRREMREMFSTVATLLHKPICYIEINADENIIKERLTKRRSADEAGYAVYQQLRLQYEEFVASHLVLRSTNDNIETMLGKALEYVSTLEMVTVKLG